jgi:hypothetical protein
MRKLVLLAALICSEVVAQQMPLIIGIIRNKAAGEITLTRERCKADPDMSLVFVRNEGGKISLAGCWKLVEYNVLVKWNDGDLYSYPIENIEFSAEYDEWYAEQRRRKGETPL